MTKSKDDELQALLSKVETLLEKKEKELSDLRKLFDLSQRLKALVDKMK